LATPQWYHRAGACAVRPRPDGCPRRGRWRGTSPCCPAGSFREAGRPQRQHGCHPPLPRRRGLHSRARRDGVAVNTEQREHSVINSEARPGSAKPTAWKNAIGAEPLHFLSPQVIIRTGCTAGWRRSPGPGGTSSWRTSSGTNVWQFFIDGGLSPLVGGRTAERDALFYQQFGLLQEHLELGHRGIAV
jgi:hypothetical protein